LAYPGKQAIIELEDPIRVGHQSRVMGDDQHHGSPLAGILCQQPNDLLSILPVQGGGGFIGEDQSRVFHQRSTDGHTLLFATGKLCGPQMGFVQQPELV